jgi:hypothetical protein
MKPAQTQNLPWPDADQWLPEQRRRAESLVLARLMFPQTLTCSELLTVARWVSTGQVTP